MILTEESRLALIRFLHDPHGDALLTYLRATPPAMPAIFTPCDGSLQPQHIQLMHGFDKGALARLEQIVALTEQRLPPNEPERVQLFDTRKLS